MPMQDTRDVYVNDDGLRRLASAHPGNHFILRDMNLRSDDDPLPYLHLNNDRFTGIREMFLLKLCDDDLIAAAMTLYPIPKETNGQDHDTLYLSQICVRAGYRGQRYSSDFLMKAFSLASRSKADLALSDTSPDGQRYLSAPLQVMHELFPAVTIRYGL